MHLGIAIVKFGLVYLDQKLVGQDDQIGDKCVLVFV